MCGIVGYVGDKEAQAVLLNGLKRLEYRGYDSSGMATILPVKNSISVRKSIGKISALEKLLNNKPLAGSAGIAHCLAPDTLVFLADGTILPISNLRDGQQVLAFNLKSQKLEPAGVRVMKHKTPPRLYEIRTSFTTLRCTAEHKMFVFAENGIIEKKVSELQKKDLLIVPKMTEATKEEKINFKPVYIKRYFKVTPEANRLIKNRLQETGLTKTGCAYSSGISASYMDHIFRNDRNFREEELNKVLSFLSLERDPSSFTPEDTIHGKFIKLPEESSPELLQIIGYLLGDGTVKERCIRFKDLDKELLFVYSGLIRKVFNVQGRVVPIQGTRAWLLEANSFYLCEWLRENIILRKESFLSELGKLPKKEISAFLRGIFDAEGCVNLKSGQISLRMTDKLLIKISQLLLLKCGVLTSFYTEKKRTQNWNDSHGIFLNNYHSFKAFRDEAGFSSRTKLTKLDVMLRERKPSVKLNALRDPRIISQEILWVKQVKAADELLFDLEVDHQDANFIANGLVSHNSRWATHGEPNQPNAHPHCDCRGEIAVVHNGIIENFAKLKEKLIKEGHKFTSETDTEVIVHLVEKFYKNCPLEDAVRRALKLLDGSYAIAVIAKNEPGKIVGARSGSPLIMGVGKGENFLASDAPAILEYTKDIIFLDEGEMAVLAKDNYQVLDLAGKPVNKKISRITWDISQAQKQGYKHFMLKEINEQPKIVADFLNLRIGPRPKSISFQEQHVPEEKLKNIQNITIVACGTAYHAGLVGKYIIEEICKIPVCVDVSSEFRYRRPLVDKKTLIIAISQSGETADTLAGMRLAKKLGAKVISICNVLGSTLTRESDGVIYTHAGPEIGVASTKAYTAQLAALYLFAFYLARIRNILSAGKIEKYIDTLKSVPKLMEGVLKRQSALANLARRYSHFGSFLYLGRNINYPSALEGALKLKEVSYIPAEGYAAGEMKHGPIALIDEYRGVVCVAVDSSIYEKMISNIQEIKSRHGKIIAIASEGNDKIGGLVKEIIYVPKVAELFSPLVVALPLQLLAYHIAVKRGCDVDQPRNLAKSVTVE